MARNIDGGELSSERKLRTMMAARDSMYMYESVELIWSDVFM
jgi:hypothetical protein